MTTLPAEIHGGRLRQAAVEFQRPLAQWLDLSTGINPNGWPVPPLPDTVWSRLPEDDDELVACARRYYRCDSLLPLPGSQAAIQLLPQLLPPTHVALPQLGYREHLRAWQQAGHQVQHYPCHDTQAIEAALEQCQVLVVINPNNPSGTHYSRAKLQDWQRRLAARGGWLVVDEAFIDASPELSLAQPELPPGLIILRSVGKFFGLAGLRAGFLLATPDLCAEVAQRMGPWSVSHPARWVCQQALQDHAWQHDTRIRLHQASTRLAALLAPLAQQNPQNLTGCTLFQTLYHAEAEALYRGLAEQGILIRWFADADRVRFGLPGHERDWQRLALALNSLSPLSECPQQDHFNDRCRP